MRLGEFTFEFIFRKKAEAGTFCDVWEDDPPLTRVIESVPSEIGREYWLSKNPAFNPNSFRSVQDKDIIIATAATTAHRGWQVE